MLGEEQGLNDQGSDYRWYVDPLDGTTNFAHGYPVFCVSMGWNIAPMRTRDAVAAQWFTIPRATNCFQRGAGKRRAPQRQADPCFESGALKECLLATGFPSHKRHKNPNIHFYHQITLRTHGVRRAGSAALDLCNVACGRFDGFWEFNLNPWDTAAGVLIVEEAGGKVTRFDGSPFQIDSRETLASNGLVHAALLREFQEIFAGRGLEALPDPRVIGDQYPVLPSGLCGEFPATDRPRAASIHCRVTITRDPPVLPAVLHF